MLSSLTVHNNSELFLNRIVTCNEKWILYDNWQQPAQWLDGEEALKTSQSQTCPPKRPWSLFGGLLPVWSTTAFWIPAKPLHLEVRSANRWDALRAAKSAARPGRQKGLRSSPWQRPAAYLTTNASEVEHIGLWSLASSTIFIWPRQPTTTSSSIWTTFGRENPSTTSRRQKMLSKSLSNPEAWFLCYKNKQIYFSLAKMSWL